MLTREPGGTHVGEQLREIVLDPANTHLADETEVLLYATARAQHVAEVIEPALRRGAIVVTDRFVDSSLAYQGVGRGMAEAVRAINGFATRGLLPDITVVLDVAAGDGLNRIVARSGPARGSIGRLSFPGASGVSRPGRPRAWAVCGHRRGR